MVCIYICSEKHYIPTLSIRNKQGALRAVCLWLYEKLHHCSTQRLSCLYCLHSMLMTVLQRTSFPVKGFGVLGEAQPVQTPEFTLRYKAQCETVLSTDWDAGCKSKRAVVGADRKRLDLHESTEFGMWQEMRYTGIKLRKTVIEITPKAATRHFIQTNERKHYLECVKDPWLLGYCKYHQGKIKIHDIRCIYLMIKLKSKL